MARLMSVALIEPQVRARSKAGTRRMGWHVLRPDPVPEGDGPPPR